MSSTSTTLLGTKVKEHDLTGLDRLCKYLEANDLSADKLKEMIQQMYYIRHQPYKTNGFMSSDRYIHFFNDVLMTAIEQNKNHIVAYLLKGALAEKDCLTREDETPMHFAVYKKNADAIVLLSEIGADLNHKNEDGLTPERLAYILKRGGDKYWQDNYFKLWGNDIKRNNIDYWRFGEYGILTTQAQQQNLELKQNNSNPVPQDKSYLTVSEQVAYIQKWQEFDTVCQTFNDIDFLTRAAELRSLNPKKYIYQNQAEAGLISDILFIASTQGLHDVLRSMKKRGMGNPNVALKDGKTPAHMAAYRVDDDMTISLLFSMGADLSKRDNKDETPYDIAMKNPDSRIALTVDHLLSPLNVWDENLTKEMQSDKSEPADGPYVSEYADSDATVPTNETNMMQHVINHKILNTCTKE